MSYIDHVWSICMEVPMPVRVPGFNLKLISPYNTAKRRRIATTSSVVVSSSS
ncbi:hypothetical protein TNCV_2240391 [Trichonephila clavipes]|nr:hypothetical protein TNCV_2240391 [Trichonephila clavipes]